MTTPTILRGSVLTTADPLGLGRVKVQVPQATGTGALWADPIQTGGAVEPVAGTAVWVMFESGNPGLPVYIPSASWGPWTAVPSSWLGGIWLPYTACYRLGPANQVQFQGELNTPSEASSTTIGNGSNVMTIPAAIQPNLTSSIPVGILPGGAGGTTYAVLRVNGASVSVYGGPWTFTGTTYMSLAALTYISTD